MTPYPARHPFVALAALALAATPAALPAQSHPLSLSLGAGFVAQRQTGPIRETAIGYTAVLGLNRPITRTLRLHADARYSFDLALGPSASGNCFTTCGGDGLSTTKVLSTVVGLDGLTSRHGLGFLFRVGGGLHLLAYPAPGRSGLYPALATAVGFRVPFGPRGAFLVEGRYDRLFGVKAGPSRLLPVLFGFEL
jgi:hypothetical protein